ncbi:MAG: DUF3500 domain-containing protein [Acidimicrobiales bacterium]
MEHWSEFGIRQNPPMSTRERVEPIPAAMEGLIGERVERLNQPLVGVTTNGSSSPGLFPLRSTGVETGPIAEAAQAFLAALTPGQRDRVLFPLDSIEWRTWLNVHMNFFRHGVMLEDLPAGTRELGLDLLRATLSTRGFEQARAIMAINGLLAELSGLPDCFGEWPYFVSIFADPGNGEPWGWQIDGHHLNINCVVIGDQVVLTPTFMGSEPRTVNVGPLAGTELFTEEETAGLAMIRSLDESQSAKAILRPSIHPDDLPAELRRPFDGRMRAGAFNDNAVVGYEGVSGAELSDAQRRLLSMLIGSYVGWTSDPHAEIKMNEVSHHLDETWFSWLGGTDDSSVFYYRVHSPVVLIEFDHHPGIVFDNDVPSRHHVHSVIRTPNGGDYGADLLRQHHERYDHSNGHHRPRD